MRHLSNIAKVKLIISNARNVTKDIIYHQIGKSAFSIRLMIVIAKFSKLGLYVLFVDKVFIWLITNARNARQIPKNAHFVTQ